MVISTQSAKAKGRKLQQYVRDKFLELLEPYGVTQDDIKSTAMGSSGEDVQLSPLARSLLPISVECKKHKQFAVYKPLEQAKANAGEYVPVLILQGDRKRPLAVIDFEYYLELESNRIKLKE